MRLLTTSTIAMAFLMITSIASANEINFKTGYISVFKANQDTNNNQPIAAAAYEAEFAGTSLIIEGGFTYGKSNEFLSSGMTINGPLAEYTEDADRFQFANLRMPFSTMLQEKELTFSAGPSIVTYESTKYTVKEDNSGYTPVTTRKFNIGLTTEANLNIIETKSFGIDVYTTLPVNFHTSFGTGFSFGATLALDI